MAHQLGKKFRKILEEKRSPVAKRWKDALYASYPEETSKILGSSRDQFANPVGHTISLAIDTIVDLLVQEEEIGSEAASSALDKIVRVRAIQDFVPSQAVSFVFELKGIVREVLRRDLEGGEMESELARFDALVDALALIAFDVYVKCREQLYDLKAEEIKKRVHMLLRKAKLVCECADQDLEPGQGPSCSLT